MSEIDSKGNVLTALDPEDVSRAIDSIAAQNIESVAVCLINSYVNPVHEQEDCGHGAGTCIRISLFAFPTIFFAK